MIAKNILIVSVVLAVVLGLVVLIGLAQQPGTTSGTGSNISLGGNLNPSIGIDSAYWSFTGESTSNYNVCLNKSRLQKYEFTLIGNSNVSISNLDGCYMNLNGQKAESELRNLEGKIKLSINAFTHFANSAQLCCAYQSNDYCSQTVNLTVCEINLTDVELPTGSVQGCNYVSDCIGYCNETLKSFRPNNCGQPYDSCSSERHCECVCGSVSYKL